MNTRKKKPLLERFWKYVNKRENDECWEWVGSVDSKGYGKILDEGGAKNGKLLAAHRVSYMIHYGNIPNGLYVCHKCDNKKCINPNHLFLGTAKDNTQDMINKNRLPDRRGENSSNHKLSNDNVIEIKRLLKNKSESISSIANKFGVGYNVIWYIAAGKTWKNVVTEKEKNDRQPSVRN